MPPRVLQVVLQLDPGGTERLVIELSKRLHRTFDCHVCCLDEAGAWAGELRDHGIEVTALQRPSGFHPSLGWKLARLAADREATVLHCHHYSPFVYGRIASYASPNLRVVFTEHGRLSDAAPSGKRKLANRWLTRGVEALYAVSHDLRRHLLDEGFPARMGVVWNGIDPGSRADADARARARQLLGLSSDALVIGTVARLDPVKDLRCAIEAFAALSQQGRHLVIVGAGTEADRLRAHARDRGLAADVHFAGARSDVRSVLPAFDIYLNSSISEGVSLTILEAMAAGLPVVATAVGGTPEVVLDGQTGLLRPARDPKALAAALTILAEAPATRLAFGVQGRARVLQHFALDAMVARYAAIYEGRDVCAASAA